MIIDLSKNEFSVLKQVISGKSFIKDLELSCSRAMKYRIVQRLVKRKLLSVEPIEARNGYAKALFIITRNNLESIISLELNNLYNKKGV